MRRYLGQPARSISREHFLVGTSPQRDSAAPRLFEFSANGIDLPGSKHIEWKQITIAPIRFDLFSYE